MSDVSILRDFKLDKIISEDPVTRRVHLLGTHAGQPAILLIEKQHFDVTDDSVSVRRLLAEGIGKVQGLGQNDVYTTLLGWTGESVAEADLKIWMICPCTEKHIRKYSKGSALMVRETPAAYRAVTLPYINSIPESDTRWVQDLLSGSAQNETYYHVGDDFVIVADFKWDQKTMSTLYLQAIVKDASLRTLRDLRKQHVPLLKAIHKEGERVVKERWGVEPDALKFAIHYQPTYYHLHIHIISIEYSSFPGLNVGQAHLLDDVISLLELDPDEGPGIMERRTLSYQLSVRKELYERMKKWQEGEGAKADA